MSNTRLYLATFVGKKDSIKQIDRSKEFQNVCLGQLAAGMFLGWASPMIPKLLLDDFSFKITTEQASWTVSLLKLGMAFGCFLSVFILDLLGRKVTILSTIIPTFFSWLLIVWNPSIWDLYVARFIGGTASGVMFTSGSMYVTEISPPHFRGALCSCFVLMDYCGNLLGYVVGSFGTMQQYAYVAMSLAILQFAMFVWFPETPYHLLRLKRFANALDSLMFFRDSGDVDEEMDSVMRSVECDPRNNRMMSSVFHLVSQPGGKGAILIGVGIMTMQAFSGSIVLIGYAQTIFQEIRGVQLHGAYMSIVLATVHLISYLASIMLVDRLGRKPLMIVSTVGVAACSFLLGIFFCLQENAADVTTLQTLSFAAILFYAASVSLGLVCVPFVVMNEIFPMYAKSTCVSLCFCVYFTWSFVILRVWSAIAFERNMYAAFWFISGLNVFGILFLAFYLPETKRKSFLTIRRQFVERTS